TIVTGMQLWTRIDLQPLEVYRRLLLLFFDPSLQARLLAGYWASDPRRLLFHRRQVLLISKLALLYCSGRGMDARTNGKRFGPVLLKANDQFHYGLIAELARAQRPIAEREDFAKIVTEMVAVSEHSSPNISHLITRSHLMLTRFANELRNDPDFVDVAAEHQKATGLTIEESEALIFGVHARFGEALVKKLFSDPGVLPLKDANFATIAVPLQKTHAFVDSIAGDTNTMAADVREKDNGPNDFTVFRKFPLVKQYYNLHLITAWCGFLMMDNLFFLEKVQTGPYWNANAIHGLKLRKFWGAVFEKYVNELMRNACASTDAVFIPDPRPLDHPELQLCDGIVVSEDSIVLMEYKSSMFRADTKYSGNYKALSDEMEKKLVQDRDANQRKGVLQLSEAVNKIFGPSQSRISLLGVDPNRFKRVFLYLITLDSIGATIGISPFLNTFLEESLDRKAFPGLQIRPVFCSDIETLEDITGFFAASSLSNILEKWFQTNPSLTTPLLAIDLTNLPWQENQWLRTEWKNIFKNMVQILFPDTDPDIALADAIKRGQNRYRP